MWTDRDAGTVSFKLREPGFLRRYEGTWTIKPACGTPMAECYAQAGPSPVSSSLSSPTSSSSSSRAASPARGTSYSPDGTPRAAAMAPFGSSSSDAGSSISSLVNVRQPALAADNGGFRVSPLASVNMMSSAGAAAGGGSFLPPGQLTGAVAAIARMQASWQQSVSNSMANFSSLGSSIASSSNNGSTGLGGFRDLGSIIPQLSSGASQALQGQLARLNSPLRGLLGNDSSSSRSRSSRDADGEADTSQRRRRPLPTSAIIMAETLTSPKVTPPYPLNQALKTQSKGQVQDMLDGLVRAAALAAAARQQ